MTTRAKRRLKRLIIRTEMPMYALTALGYPVCIAMLIWAAPTVSGLQLACITLFIGFTAALGAWASALKTDDTEE